jgi:hypothetical protein
MHDSQFFEHLIRQRTLPFFQVCSNSFATGQTRGGASRFTEALNALPALPGFSNLKNIILAADNDSDPNTSFANIVNAINLTEEILGPPARRLLAPHAPRIKSQSVPCITILMLPNSGVPGNLDDICYVAAANKRPGIASCVDTFAACTSADQWSPNKLIKMKIRSLIAGSWRNDPSLSPTYVWSENTDLVPLTDSVFDDVSTFLSQF